MIELLLQAERALGTGHLDQAERLYWQAIDADGQNAIAIVGLAKVARLRGDDRTAIAFGRRALKVDGENAVARRLVTELETAHPEEPRHGAGSGEKPRAGESAGGPADAPPAPPPPPSASGATGALGGKAEVEWPVADLQQPRPPRDR